MSGTVLSPSRLFREADISDVISNFIRRARELTWPELARVSFYMTLTFAGNTLQIVALNFWVRSFPKDIAGSKFTAFAVSNFFIAFFFLVSFLIYYYRNYDKIRPISTWFCSSRSMLFVLITGCCDMLNRVSETYAAEPTPTVDQALFNSVQPVFIFLFSKFLLKDERDYCNRWAVVAFGLMITGVLLAAVPDFAEPNVASWWLFVYFMSVPFHSLYNVLQALYMKETTIEEGHKELEENRKRTAIRSLAQDGVELAEMATAAEESDAGVAGAGAGGGGAEPSPVSTVTADDDDDDDDEKNKAAPAAAAAGNTGGGGGGVSPAASPAHQNTRREEKDGHLLLSQEQQDEESSSSSSSSAQPHRGEGDTVKVVLLLGSCTVQFVLGMVMLPLDALAWWGESPTVSEAGTRFGEGIRCVFTCTNNGIYAALYSLGFVAMYVGSIVLNEYSATLCSMITQLAGPITAILLLIVPQWNLNEGASKWYFDTGAIVLLSSATFIFAVWEEQSRIEELRADQRETVEGGEVGRALLVKRGGDQEGDDSVNNNNDRNDSDDGGRRPSGTEEEERAGGQASMLHQS